MAEREIERYLESADEALAAAGVSRRRRAALVREWREHLDLEAASLRREGVAPAEAGRRAVVRFGPARELARAWAEADRPPTAVGRWAAASITAIACGAPLALPAGRLADAWLGMMLLLPAAGLVLGAAVGLGQGWAMRQRARRAAGWVAGSGVGLALGVTGGTVLVEGLGLRRDGTLEELAGLTLLGAVAGGTTALVQWAFARGGRRDRGRWTAASAAGFAIGVVAAGGCLAAAGGSPSIAELPWFLAAGTAGSALSVVLHAPTRRALGRLAC